MGGGNSYPRNVSSGIYPRHARVSCYSTQPRAPALRQLGLDAGGGTSCSLTLMKRLSIGQESVSMGLVPHAGRRSPLESPPPKALTVATVRPKWGRRVSLVDTTGNGLGATNVSWQASRQVHYGRGAGGYSA
eukprot:gene10644-biopygen9282